MSERIQQHKPQSADAGHDDVRQRQAAPALQDNRQAPNRTGMPGQLKAGIEALSGMNMDHVRVHYNSDRPAQLQALAYAQGSDIHLAPGQEQHLPHEAWHVVQQAQGRVRPTMQMQGGVQVNDDTGLEREADVMGGRAAAVRSNNSIQRRPDVTPSAGSAQLATQLKTEVYHYSGLQAYKDHDGNNQRQLVGRKVDAYLDPFDPIIGSESNLFERHGIYTDPAYVDQSEGAPIAMHLLNAHLGGLATDINLFPGRGSLNKGHSKQLEEVAKAMLLSLEDMAGASNSGVRLHYELEVESASVLTPENLASSEIDASIPEYVGPDNKRVDIKKYKIKGDGLNGRLAKKGWNALTLVKDGGKKISWFDGIDHNSPNYDGARNHYSEYLNLDVEKAYADDPRRVHIHHSYGEYGEPYELPK